LGPFTLFSREAVIRQPSRVSFGEPSSAHILIEMLDKRYPCDSFVHVGDGTFKGAIHAALGMILYVPLSIIFHVTGYFSYLFNLHDVEYKQNDGRHILEVDAYMPKLGFVRATYHDGWRTGRGVIRGWLDIEASYWLHERNIVFTVFFPAHEIGIASIRYNTICGAGTRGRINGKALMKMLEEDWAVARVFGVPSEVPEVFGKRPTSEEVEVLTDRTHEKPYMGELVYPEVPQEKVG